jgi:hypothetical protein
MGDRITGDYRPSWYVPHSGGSTVGGGESVPGGDFGGANSITGGGGGPYDRSDSDPDLPPPGQVSLGALMSIDWSRGSFMDAATVLVEAQIEMIEAAREDRAAARDANMAQLQQAADEIMSQATFALVAGLTTGVIGAIGAAANLGTQMKAIKVEAQAQKLGLKATDLDVDAGRAQVRQEAALSEARNTTGDLAQANQSGGNRASAEIRAETRRQELYRDAEIAQEEGAVATRDAATIRADVAQKSQTANAMNQKGAAWQQIGNSLGQLGAAGLNFAAAGEEEDKARAQAEAEKARTLAEDQSDFKRGYEEMMRKVIDIFSAVRQAEREGERAITVG